jgi:hypothetical protein
MGCLRVHVPPRSDSAKSDRYRSSFCFVPSACLVSSIRQLSRRAPLLHVGLHCPLLFFAFLSRSVLFLQAVPIVYYSRLQTQRTFRAAGGTGPAPQLKGVIPPLWVSPTRAILNKVQPLMIFFAVPLEMLCFVTVTKHFR